MALLSIRPPFEPQAPCASTVAVIQSSGPLEEIVGFCAPEAGQPDGGAGRERHSRGRKRDGLNRRRR